MNLVKLIQQGDVLAYRTDLTDLPGDLSPRPCGKEKILAEGEVTGHHHAFTADSTVVVKEDEDGTLWCHVCGDQPAVITHQEHKPVTLEPGVYKIGAVREVDPFSEEVRKVRD